ncbi:hypothetical protein HKK74_38505 [Actinomadura alba]|uniref:Uncharacterized protein n=1 Tax=Actinomadura alba TaxID=406431 RepID=A0ABR7M2S6_9ACTN|nr:hypothetical protein [Actinomadura alba]
MGLSSNRQAQQVPDAVIVGDRSRLGEFVPGDPPVSTPTHGTPALVHACTSQTVSPTNTAPSGDLGRHPR